MGANLFYLRRAVWLNGVCASPLVPNRGRFLLLRAFGAKVAPSNISCGVWFSNALITIGRGTYIGRHCVFDSAAPIEIGDHVNLAMDVLLLTGSHAVGDQHRRAGPLTAEPIRIGNGAWLGARVTVLPGVVIGSGAIIAAGAVVTKECEANALYAGVPARWVRTLIE